MLRLDDIAYVVGVVALVLLSTSVHEFSHAMAAHLLGDDTAKEQGRLTLNPLAHIDPVGSVALPLIMALAHGPVFAYANPVPYNPNRLRNPGRDDALVALAGPLSNIAQALAAAVILKLLTLAGQRYVLDGNVLYALSLYLYLNLSLAFFNLIPLPPLDGSKLIMPFLSNEARRSYYGLQRYSMVILLVVLYGLPRFLGIDVVGFVIDHTAWPLYQFLMGV